MQQALHGDRQRGFTSDRSDFVIAHTNQSAATTAYTSSTVLKNTGEDRWDKLPRCRRRSRAGVPLRRFYRLNNDCKEASSIRLLADNQ